MMNYSDMATAITLPFKIQTQTPIQTQQQQGLDRGLAILWGTLFLATAAWIEVPMIPVPMNMQSFAVAMLGALYGWRLGTATILFWLIEGAMGLPVFSGGAAGLLHFIGPTGGYLFAFPLMAMLIGWLTDSGRIVNNIALIALSLIAMLMGHMLCLAMGATWLALIIGGEKAWAVGVVPFLLGDILKSALATATVAMVRIPLSASALPSSQDKRL